MTTQLTSYEFVIVKQASSYLSVTVGCIYHLVAAGEINHVRVGTGRGTIRIPLPALEEYVARHTHPSPRRRTANTSSGSKRAFEHLDSSRLIRAWNESPS